MKFNFDSKILAVQIPSGIILGILSILISRYIHLPFLPTKIQLLIGLILLLDLLHLFGKLNIDISNLCKREKFIRNIENEKPLQIIQIYLEEHLVFLLCFFASLFISQLIFHFWHK